MEVSNGHAYGYPHVQTNLASGSYLFETIDPRMFSTESALSHNMDTELRASQTNTPTEITQPNVHNQNNPLAEDGNPSPAKKRRGRPPGSKNKVKVDAPLYRPEQPKPQGRVLGSKKKPKSSLQSPPDAQGVGLSLPQGFEPGISQPSIARNQNNANQSYHLTVGQTHSGVPPQADHQGHSSSEAMQFQHPDPGFQDLPAYVDPQVLNRSDGERVQTYQAGSATAFLTEGTTPDVISPIEPIRAFNIANWLQPLTMPHRQGCPCRGCYIDRPYEGKTTRSGAPFDVFASIVGDAAAAAYIRHEEISYTMGDYAHLPPAEFKDKQQQSLEESLDTDPLTDRQGNPVEYVPLPSMMKEQVVRMMNQKLQDLERRNKTFTAVPPCVTDGTFDVDEYIMYEVEGGRNVEDDDMYEVEGGVNVEDDDMYD